MPFAYVEPTIEELNARIAGGQTFIQSDLSGEYREYYVAPTPEELALVQTQPVISWEQAQIVAAESQNQTPEIYQQQGGYQATPQAQVTVTTQGGVTIQPGALITGEAITQDDVVMAFKIGLLLGSGGRL